MPALPKPLIKLPTQQRKVFRATCHGKDIHLPYTCRPTYLRTRLLTAVGVTVPGTYWILSTGNVKAEHSHPGEAHHGSEHADDEEHTEEEPSEEQPEEDSASKEESSSEDEPKDESDKDKSSDPDENGGSERSKGAENRYSSSQPPTGQTKDEGLAKKGMAGSQPEGQKAKSDNEGKNVPEEPNDDDQISEKSVSGSGKFGEKQELENEKEGAESLDRRLHVPDAKGGAKRRVESRNGKDLAPVENVEGDTEDKAAPSKDAPPNSTSQKQQGLSNTNTKHSTDPGNNPEISKKGEGAPETAKMQGTVDPNRPAR